MRAAPTAAAVVSALREKGWTLAHVAVGAGVRRSRAAVWAHSTNAAPEALRACLTLPRPILVQAPSGPVDVRTYAGGLPATGV